MHTEWHQASGCSEQPPSHLFTQTDLRLPAQLINAMSSLTHTNSILHITILASKLLTIKTRPQTEQAPKVLSTHAVQHPSRSRQAEQSTYIDMHNTCSGQDYNCGSMMQSLHKHRHSDSHILVQHGLPTYIYGLRRRLATGPRPG